MLLGGNYAQQLYIKLVSKFLEHSSVQLILSTYGHVLPWIRKAVANKMDALLSDAESAEEASIDN